MACNFPYEIKNKEGNICYVPCGRCLQCRIDRREMWIDRLMFELTDNDGVFLTLTYNDFFYPGQLVKSDVQKFFKRLRKSLDCRKIKYYCVGEYGELGGEHNYYVDTPNLGRAHYHAIVIGLSPLKDFKFIRSAWPFGFIKVGPANHATIRYTLKYMDKQLSQKDWVELHGDITRPFALMSNGIGLKFLLKNQDIISELGGYYKNGKLRPLPKYYRQFLSSPIAGFSDSKRNKILETMECYNLTACQAMNKLGMSNEYELISRMRLYGEKYDD